MATGRNGRLTGIACVCAAPEGPGPWQRRRRAHPFHVGHSAPFRAADRWTEDRRRPPAPGASWPAGMPGALAGCGFADAHGGAGQGRLTRVLLGLPGGGARERPEPRPFPTPAATPALHDIWMADGRAEAERAMNTFAAKYDAKYPQAVACRTATPCWPSTTSRPSTGGISGRPTPSKASSLPSATAPCAPRAACLTGQLWPWSSSRLAAAHGKQSVAQGHL